jgi:hypothetical protein
MGYGLELADERAVCATIVQEFMTSPAVSGLWREQGAPKPKPRFFGISREEQYLTSSSEDRPEMADLVIEKFEEQKNGTYNVSKPRSFIEAKRARLWRMDLKSGKVSRGARQTRKICGDIEKLVRESAERKKRRMEEIFVHVLVWGIYEEDLNGKPLKSADHPKEFFDEVEKKSGAELRLHGVRWLPTKWNSPTEGCPQIQRTSWIALCEIDGAK